MILFSIPDFYGFFHLNLRLLELKQQEPEKLYSDIVIDSVYGSFPCIWNGGRFYPGSTTYDNILATVTPFMDYGVSIRHTFTNCLLTEEHFSDVLCNKICELTENPLNGININSPALKQFLEQKYPQFYYMWSTTICEEGLNNINTLSEHNLVVLDYNLNNKFDLLKQLQYPQNIEILVCETCIPNCPNRKTHYIHESNCQLYNESNIYACPWANDNFFQGACKQPHHVTIEDIRKYYLPMGINKFKIMGRGRPMIETIENYVNYFVLPEYKDEIRYLLLKSII